MISSDVLLALTALDFDAGVDTFDGARGRLSFRGPPARVAGANPEGKITS